MDETQNAGCLAAPHLVLTSEVSETFPITDEDGGGVTRLFHDLHALIVTSGIFIEDEVRTLGSPRRIPPRTLKPPILLKQTPPVIR